MLDPILTPGIYDLTNEEYHADPATSSSAIATANEKSLSHVWKGSPENPNRKPRRVTPEMKLGTAIHSYLLERTKFEATYLVAPRLEDYPEALVTVDDLKGWCKDHNLLTSGKKQDLIDRILSCGLSQPHIWDIIKFEFEEESDGAEVVEPEEKDMFAAMAKALGEQSFDFGGAVHKLSDLFKHGKAEESFFWKEPHSGLMCRCRTDWRIVMPGLKLIIDYKSTKSAQKSAFQRQAGELYYWARAAMYVDGVEAVTGERYDYILLPQEKEEPFLACVYHYDSHHLDLGRELYISTLLKIAEAKETGIWPGYSNELKVLEIPNYMYDRHPELGAIARGEIEPMYAKGPTA